MYTKEESKNIRLEFWKRFKDYSALRRRQKGKPANWIMNNTGIKQLKLKFEFDENQAVVGIDIETRNTDKRIELYDKLEKLKKILEEKLNQDLIWELDYIQPSGKSISRVCLKKKGVNIYEKETWAEVFPFFYKNMIKLEDFYEEFRDMLKH
jgi:Domain of unknown function (DUF4268)